MPEDDWDMGENDTDDADDDTPAGGTGTDKPADDVTPEERDALRALRETGMAPGEVIARARRDYQQETHGHGGNAGAPAPAPADDGATDDPEAVMTVGQYSQMQGEHDQKIKHEARMEALQVQQYGLMQEAVGEEIGKGLGEDMPGYKCKAIADEVAARLGKNVKLMTLPQREFAAEVRTVAKQVIDEERKLAAGIAGAANATELDSRLDAQVGAGESGARGGAGKRSAKQGRLAEMKQSVEEPPFGVSEGRNWPSDADIEDVHTEEMKEHRANVKAGRV